MSENSRSIEDVGLRFMSHGGLTEADFAEMDATRMRFINLARAIQATGLPSREQSLALTKLEEASFWATAAIARAKGKPIDPSK